LFDHFSDGNEVLGQTSTFADNERRSIVSKIAGPSQ